MSLFQHSAMALGESAIQVKYNGNKGFASVTIDPTGGDGASPLISVGVSDTSVAQAVTNMVTAFSGVAASTLDDIIWAIKKASGGTVGGDDEISIGDFDCRVKDGVKTDSVYHATSAMFASEAGTAQNLRGYKDSTTGSNWFSTLVRDNDAEASYAIYLRVPRPDMSQGGVVIRSITGISTQAAGTAITNGLLRQIISDAGTVLWTYSDATATATEGKFDLEGPVAFDGPVVIKDSCLTPSDYAELDATSTTVLWGLPGNNV